MTVQTERPAAPTQSPTQRDDAADFDLDITIVESGPAADQLIRLTNDGCNSTCASACVSCP
ncbi:FxLD family lanthipeptide [Streptomyces griseoaurantiacus]|uniref:FxLD family lantipeptide n=1 Tax=Streptomyces griseoaurantiacus TaxID=68213 RepID=A0A7W2DX05_9ACTN|nr:MULTISPECIES: FxLD family lanthipeptide [Streptomyces]MBA5224566.1 FxLD family lantipeptide [Streptomyces griseoaurantiacus]